MSREEEWTLQTEQQNQVLGGGKYKAESGYLEESNSAKEYVA